MLGVTDYVGHGPADKLIKELGEELGVGDTFRNTRVGVFFGEPGKTVDDPYFGGEGPPRTGCLRIGRCMVGCPHKGPRHRNQLRRLARPSTGGLSRDASNLEPQERLLERPAPKLQSCPALEAEGVRGRGHRALFRTAT